MMTPLKFVSSYFWGGCGGGGGGGGGIRDVILTGKCHRKLHALYIWNARGYFGENNIPLLTLVCTSEIKQLTRTCDYRVITAREIHVKHEAIAMCFTCISSAVVTR